MGYLYRPMVKKGNLPEGVKRCGDASHGKADTCPACGARFGPHWWAKYYANSQVIRENTKSEKETEARRFLKRREGKAAAGERVNPKADRVLVAELLDDLLVDYRTNARKNLKGITRIVTRLKTALGHYRAHHLATADVRAYIATRQTAPGPDEEGAANATINRELAALKRAFNLALKDGKIHQKPHFPMLTEDNVRTGFLGEIEFLALHTALPAPLNHMLAFAYTYGWRKSEVVGLRWDRVDLPKGTARLDVGTTKNGEGRTVALTDDLRAVFSRLWDETRALAEQKGQPIPWVFHRDGQRVKDFRGAWDAACKTAGVPGLIFHDLRRSAVRRMERAGVPRSVAMRITGHRTESVYRRYAIVSEADLMEATRKLSVMGTGTGTERVGSHLPDLAHHDNPA